MQNVTGMIGVDKMGAEIIFLDPTTYKVEKTLKGFQRTVHELLVVPETGTAYVPIFGDGIHGRNPNPGYLLCVIDLKNRTHAADIDLRPYIAPHTLKLAPTDLSTSPAKTARWLPSSTAPQTRSWTRSTPGRPTAIG
jgi:hypothetical protein